MLAFYSLAPKYKIHPGSHSGTAVFNQWNGYRDIHHFQAWSIKPTLQLSLSLSLPHPSFSASVSLSLPRSLFLLYPGWKWSPGSFVSHRLRMAGPSSVWPAKDFILTAPPRPRPQPNPLHLTSIPHHWTKFTWLKPQTLFVLSHWGVGFYLLP